MLLLLSDSACAMSLTNANSNLDDFQVLPSRHWNLITDQEGKSKSNLVKRTTGSIDDLDQMITRILQLPDHNGDVLDRMITRISQLPDDNGDVLDRMITRISQIRIPDPVPLADQTIDTSSEEYQQSLVDAVKEASEANDLKVAANLASEEALMIKIVSNGLRSLRQHHVHYEPHAHHEPHDFHFPPLHHEAHHSHEEHHAKHGSKHIKSDSMKAIQYQPKFEEIAADIIDPKAISMMVVSRVCTRLTYKMSPQLCTAVGYLFNLWHFASFDPSEISHVIASGYIKDLSPSNKAILGATCLIAAPLITNAAATGCLISVIEMSANSLIFDGIIAVYNQFADEDPSHGNLDKLTDILSSLRQLEQRRREKASPYSLPETSGVGRKEYLKENLNFARPDLQNGQSTRDSNAQSNTENSNGHYAMNVEQIETDFRNSGIRITAGDRLISQRTRQIIMN